MFNDEIYILWLVQQLRSIIARNSVNTYNFLFPFPDRELGSILSAIFSSSNI